MADQQDLVPLGALSVAVVALSRGLEYVIQRWRSPQGTVDAATHSLAERLAVCEKHVAILQAGDVAHHERERQVCEWLARLDNKLDQLMLR